MQYKVTKPYLGSKCFLAISQEEFLSTKYAWSQLLTILAIEEKFNLLLENYVEFERELLNLTLHNMVFSARNYSLSADQIYTINRRVVNFLSTCKLYLDHTPHSLSSLYGEDCEQKKAFDRLTHTEFDNHLGYRISDALRNFIQHRDIFINRAEFSFNWEKQNDDTDILKYVLSFYIDPSKIKEDKKIKKSTIKEIEGLGEKIDIKPFLRQYIESLSVIHSRLRDLWIGDVTNWDAIIDNIRIRYESECDKESKLLEIVEYDDSSTWIDHQLIAEEIVQRRKWLKSRNILLTPYSTSAVSSEVSKRR